MICVTPESEATGDVDVEVANNGIDYSSNSVKFLFRAAESVSSLAPTEGPTTGGVQVTVSGSNFVSSEDLMCRFDSTLAPATYVNASNILCTSPARGEGLVTVEASNNRVDFTTNQVQFEFYKAFIATGITPMFVSVLGGTQITISGLPFATRSTPLCRFGTSVVTGAYGGTSCNAYTGLSCSSWNAVQVLCQTPALDAGYMRPNQLNSPNDLSYVK